MENDDQKGTPTNQQATAVTNSIFVKADLTACYKTGTNGTETHAIKTTKARVAGDKGRAFFDIDPAAKADFLRLGWLEGVQLFNTCTLKHYGMIT